MTRSVVGGLAVLREMEKLRTDASDRPTKPLTLVKTIVLANPFDLADQIMKRDLEIEKAREKAVESREWHSPHSLRSRRSAEDWGIC